MRHGPASGLRVAPGWPLPRRPRKARGAPAANSSVDPCPGQAPQARLNPRNDRSRQRLPRPRPARVRRWPASRRGGWRSNWCRRCWCAGGRWTTRSRWRPRPWPKPRDRAFARALAATVLRRLGQLDALIADTLDRPLPRKAVAVRDVLRLGLAQLLFLGTPPQCRGLHLRRPGRGDRPRDVRRAGQRRPAPDGPGRARPAGRAGRGTARHPRMAVGQLVRRLRRGAGPAPSRPPIWPRHRWT